MITQTTRQPSAVEQACLRFNEHKFRCKQCHDLSFSLGNDAASIAFGLANPLPLCDEGRDILMEIFE